MNQLDYQVLYALCYDTQFPYEKKYSWTADENVYNCGYKLFENPPWNKGGSQTSAQGYVY